MSRDFSSHVIKLVFQATLFYILDSLMSLLVEDLFLDISHKLHELGPKFFITRQIFLQIIYINFLVILRVTLTSIINVDIDDLGLFDKPFHKLLSEPQFALFSDELFLIHSFLLSFFEPLIFLVISVQLFILSN